MNPCELGYVLLGVFVLMACVVVAVAFDIYHVEIISRCLTLSPECLATTTEEGHEPGFLRLGK